MPTPPTLHLVLDLAPQAESPTEHCRNALMLVRVLLHLSEPMLNAPDGPSLVVPVDGLAAIQARLEAALEGMSP